MLGLLGLVTPDKLSLNLEDALPCFLRPPRQRLDSSCAPQDVPDDTMLNGSVQLQLARARRCPRITVTLVCTVELLSRASGTVARESFRSELVHNIGELDMLGPGDHNFGFSFRIPATSSPTAKSRHGKIMWELSARTHGPAPLTAKMPLEVCVIRPGADLGEAGSITQMIRGMTDELGIYEFNFNGDGHIGGRYLFDLVLPSSAEGVRIRSVMLYIRQFQVMDVSFACGDGGAGSLEEPLPIPFTILRLGVDEPLPGDVAWPKPNPAGCKFVYSGFLPRCRDSIKWNRDFIQPSTPPASSTAFRIDHDMVFEVDYSVPDSIKCEKLRFVKPISLSTCAIATERTRLPSYASTASWQDLEEPTTREVLCACKLSELAGRVTAVPSRESLVK